MSSGRIHRSLRDWFYIIYILFLWGKCVMKKLKEQDDTDQRILKKRGKSCPPFPRSRDGFYSIPDKRWQVFPVSPGAACSVQQCGMCSTPAEQRSLGLPPQHSAPKAIHKKFTHFPHDSPSSVWKQQSGPSLDTRFPRNTSSIPWGTEESAVLNSVLCTPGACLHLIFYHLQASCDYPLHY